ncbi:hypothetical protein N7478_012084 [Penicillium angulare]|uniref:uncharacterized protein n=1 Tax=Penicillium angulare TaxID=116970 RepID=UPI002541B1CC|nr:uncharacterized protein N7478_012084 [Penicillium angulare]KAJ5260479.1 hypothetical protein N7478_012084 [Penicillium angulare]
MTVSVSTPAISPPRMLPLGTSQPPGDKYAISLSLPTWDSVPGRPRGYNWVLEKLQANYPSIVQQLTSAVLERCAIPAERMHCLVFSSKHAARRCIVYLQKHHSSDIQTDVVSFYISHEATIPISTNWDRFYAVIYDVDAKVEASEFWSIFGDGISSRHAEFCLQLWLYTCSESRNKSWQFYTSTGIGTGTDRTPIRMLESLDAEQAAKTEIRDRIANLIASDNPEFTPPSATDVFLYTNGMSAISAMARALVPEKKTLRKQWPYAETPKCVSNSGYERFKIYSQGTTDELDQLEASLALGSRIRVLFCEVPSNPLLRTPDLHRIRSLADQYDFIVVCDETLGTFVNVDILPYVDVAITSLTKVFNGSGNAMGGSAVVNPQSRYYSEVHAKLTDIYEDLLFPTEALVLAENSRDFQARVHKSSANALALATFLSSHPSIESVLYPSLIPTRKLYDHYRRKNGGYGYVMSLLFREPNDAIRFYDTLDMCKGPSIGTNFSLAIPYAQLAHVFDLDWAESQGIPKHIVRLSVGLESEDDLVECVSRALEGLVSP